MNVTHLAWRHRADDIRIFERECQSLSCSGIDVTYLVPNSENHSAEGVNIVSVDTTTGQRYLRYFRTLRNITSTCHHLNTDIYHIHEPELIPIGILLKNDGKKVIYDSHEMTRHQKWSAEIPLWQKLPETITAAAFEKAASYLFDGIVAATPEIKKTFPEVKSITVTNFPKLENFESNEQTVYEDRANHVVYVGGIARKRGIKDMVEAMSLLPEHLDVRLQIAGEFTTEQLRKEVISMDGWGSVDFHGWVSHEEVFELLEKSKVGLICFHPTTNNANGIPNKLFEYMAAGLPVIASDFDSWEKYIKHPSCGRFVDPTSSQEIADQIEWMFKNEARAESMGNNARRMVERRYNWESQAENLIQLYQSI